MHTPSINLDFDKSRFNKNLYHVVNKILFYYLNKVCNYPKYIGQLMTGFQ